MSGPYTYSSAGTGSGARSMSRSSSASGRNQRSAMAVGSTADKTTTVISNENWVRLMIPAFRPYSEEIVPNVRPVS